MCSYDDDIASVMFELFIGWPKCRNDISSVMFKFLIRWLICSYNDDIYTVHRLTNL